MNIRANQHWVGIRSGTKITSGYQSGLIYAYIYIYINHGLQISKLMRNENEEEKMAKILHDTYIVLFMNSLCWVLFSCSLPPPLPSPLPPFMNLQWISPSPESLTQEALQVSTHTHKHTHIWPVKYKYISSRITDETLVPYLPTTLLCAKGCCCSLHLLLPHYKVHNTTTTIDKSMIFVSVNNFKRVLQVPTSLPLLKPKQVGPSVCMYVCMYVWSYNMINQPQAISGFIHIVASFIYVNCIIEWA